MASTRPPKPSLLGLPLQLRLRIYAFVGILDGHPYPRFIDLNNKTLPATDTGPPYFTESDKTALLITHALLLTCRLTYKDVSALVYTGNHFFIRYYDTQSLEALRRLSPSSMHALRRLTIHLNVVSCGLGQPCDRELDPWYKSDYDGHTNPLYISDLAAQDLLLEWHQTWHDLLRPNIIGAHRLSLSFICDVGDEETATQVLKPLLNEQKPFLQTCNIRLSHIKDRVLVEMAREAVLATSTPTSGPETLDWSNNSPLSSFPFLKLPAEIRQHILRYTDLVARWREVEWNPTVKKYYIRSLAYPTCHNIPSIEHGQEEMFEEMKGDYVDKRRGENSTCWTHAGYWEQSRRTGCFCTSYHSAWYIVGGLCKCWAPPTAFFLVCRLMRQDALQVFFSNNKFIIVPTGSGVHCRADESPPDRLAPSIFLNDIVPKDGLRYLRALELVFPPFQGPFSCTYCPPRSPTQQDWIQTLRNITSSLVVSRLSISIHFDMHFPCYHHNTYTRIRELNRNGEFLIPMTSAELQAVKATFVGTITPLKILGRGQLKYFSAHLLNPARCCLGPGPRYREDWEKELEKLVMGISYDSAAAGKTKLVKGRWEDDRLSKYNEDYCGGYHPDSELGIAARSQT